MKKISKLFNTKHIIFYKKSIAMALSFLILFNLSAEAFVSIEQLAPKELQTELREALEEVAVQNKTPQEFLSDLEKQLEEAVKEENSTTAKTDNNGDLQKLTKEKYISIYNTSINKEYNKYTNEVETEAQKAINAFEEEANKTLEEQKNLVVASKTSSLNIKLPSNDKLFNGKTDLLNPVTKKVKLDTSAYQTQQLLNAPSQEQTTLKQLEEAISKQREEFTKEVSTWKETTLTELKAEHKKLLSGGAASYDKYSKEYNNNLKEFYTELVKEVVANFKKTNDMESKKKFVSILFYLTSIKSSEIDRNSFIVGEEREFIKNFLKANFSAKGNACVGTVKTIYSDNSTWGSSAIGGSPSAGKMFDNSSNKTAVFEFANKDACDLALSSMLPYANLNGDGYAFTNFISQYYNSPVFGSMLEIVVKSLLLTNNRGEEALSKFIDKSIELENKARNDKGNLWQKLDIITFEGFSNSQVFDGKYCNHNLCSSADSGYEDPNAWEEVAYMLADAQKTNLLNKAISQCKIVATKNYYQHMECQGIYPFLFGALVSKPELANNVKPIKTFQEFPGPTLDEYGRSHYITTQEAAENKKKNEIYDITKKHPQGEWISAFLILQSFEDVHPAAQLRMNNIVAKSAVLNPKKHFESYTKDSKTYKKSLNKYNTKQVLLGLASYADFLVAVVCIKDLLRLGIVSVSRVKNLVKVTKAIRAYKSLPNSFGKAIKITKVLSANNISAKTVSRMNKFRKFNKNPLHFTSSAVVARMGGESQALIGSVSGRISGVKNGVLVGSQEFLRPISGSYKSKVLLKQGGLGGTYVAGGANALKTTPETPLSFKDTFKAVGNNIKYGFVLSPWLKPNPKDVPNLDISKLSLEILDEKGNPVKVTSMSIDDNVLYINGDMFKTFKATLPEDQLEIINQLVKNHNVNLGIEGFYIKPLWNKAPTRAEKMASRWNNSELVDIFDINGNVVMKLGLNKGYKNEASLLSKIAGKSPVARLIYTNGALFIEEGGNLAKIEGLTGLSLPKTAIFNMTKDKNVAFLNELFSMPKRADASAPLKFSGTNSKIGWVFLTQALSYSAASSSLMMTMEKPPFNRTPAESVVIGLFLPYIWSFASPLMAPLVKMWGAKPVFLASMGVAGAGLINAIANGYWYNATNELDSQRRLIPQRDSNGNIIYANPNAKNPVPVYELRKKPLPVWPLFVASATSGLAAAGIRATSNILVKSYELNKTTMNVSMLFKNVGGLAFTAIPFAFNAFTSKDVKADFSLTYPFLVGLTAVAAVGIGVKMPKMNIPGYKAKFNDFLKPWKLLFTPQIAPYTIGMMGVCSLEGYVYFKGVNALARDTFEGYGLQPENAKFLASLFTALPQFMLRWKSPRKVFFGRGLFNSAALATTGTLLMLLPSNHLSVHENAAIGLVAGTALGLGTAQVYQYSQKLVLSQVEKAGNIARSDAIVLYSMSNLGLILPTLFAMGANKRKSDLNEGEFEATRNTFYWPIIFYATGMSAIADAERGFKMFPAVTKNIVKPAIRYSIEGAALNKNINQLKLKTSPTFNNNQFNPAVQPLKVGNLNLQTPVFTPAYNIVAPQPTLSEEKTEEETEDSKETK